MGFAKLAFLAMELAVSLRSLVVLLGSFPALSGVDLDIQSGEIVYVRGANGAGKTTLLRFCAGLLNFYSGEGQVLGFDIRDANSDTRQLWRTQVGYLGHETRLYPDLTAQENLAFLVKLCRAEMAALQYGVERLELSQELLATRVGSLSAGQRRRVALAGVVLRSPKLWLLDEPHASLDSRGRSCVDQLIVDAAKAGATLLVVTHEPVAHELLEAVPADLSVGESAASGSATAGSEAAGSASGGSAIARAPGSSRLVELSGGAVKGNR